MKILVCNILIVLVLAGCNSGKNQSSDADSVVHGAHEHDEHNLTDPRLTEVMAIHDSLMTSMGSIMNLSQKVSTDIKTTDSLLAVKSNATLIKRKEDALALANQLEKADTEMMNWMHQYKADTLKKLSEEQTTAYISDQKIKIEAVRTQMNKSIGDARAFLDKKREL